MGAGWDTGLGAGVKGTAEEMPNKLQTILYCIRLDQKGLGRIWEAVVRKSPFPPTHRDPESSLNRNVGTSTPNPAAMAKAIMSNHSGTQADVRRMVMWCQINEYGAMGAQVVAKSAQCE